IDDEVLRVQIVRVLWIDEDVGERRRGIGDVPRPFELENLADETVDPRSTPLSDVDTRLIGLVIDDQDRELVGVTLCTLEPRQQAPEPVRILLDNGDEPQILLVCDLAQLLGSLEIS